MKLLRVRCTIFYIFLHTTRCVIKLEILMENPFSYSGIVTGEAFCNRESEMSELGQLAKDSQNVLIYSHRKTGKSSLLFELFSG